MCSLQRNYDVIRNWERFETGTLTVVPYKHVKLILILNLFIVLLKQCYPFIVLYKHVLAYYQNVKLVHNPLHRGLKLWFFGWF